MLVHVVDKSSMSSIAQRSNMTIAPCLKVVAYGRIKTMKNSETVNESFELLVVIWLAKFENFGVLNRWSVMGGGRLRGVLA